jgi:hypothetical protein
MHVTAPFRCFLATIVVFACANAVGAEAEERPGAPRDRLEDRVRPGVVVSTTVPQSTLERVGTESGEPDRFGGGITPGLVFQGVSYEVVATRPRLNRRVTGPVTRWVQGVPAEPVDSFVYDGVGSEPIEGTVTLRIDPVNNVGVIEARWVDPDGIEWLYSQTRFAHPEHSAGVRIGSSVNELESLIKVGVTHNVYLHGDTTAGMPVLPTVFNHLATWGPADVLRDGQPFVNPFELPAPQWIGHLMVTEGVRREDGTVRTKTGEIYHPSDLDNGEVDPGDLEVHLVFHDERFPRTSNNPPIFSFFYHLVFEDVSIQILQADGLKEVRGPRSGLR